MSIYNTNGRGLTKSEEQTLKYLYYDPNSNKLQAERTLATEPSTVEVGNHSISSGGENVFFTNRTGNIDWHPAWQGVKSQQDTLNQFETGIIPPTFRHYKTDLLELELDGIENPTGAVDYNADSAVGINNSVFGQEVILAEDVAPDDWLRYEVRVGTASDPIVYQQILTGVNLTAGQRLIWWFDHPVEGRAGTQINSRMLIAKGGQDEPYNFLQVRPASGDLTRRYIKIKYRLFTDEDVQSGVIFTTESQKIRYAAQYAVDTSGGGITLDVNSQVGYRSFYVFDAMQSFSIANPCTINFTDTGQGSVVLSAKNDSYLYYFDGTIWRYLDQNTKNGGIV